MPTSRRPASTRPSEFLDRTHPGPADPAPPPPLPGAQPGRRARPRRRSSSASLNHRFFRPANLSLVPQQVAVVGALAVGQTLIILTAGIDLSVGAIMVFTSMVMAGSAVNVRASRVRSRS